MRGQRLRPGEHGDIRVTRKGNGRYQAECWHVTMSGHHVRIRRSGGSYAEARRLLEKALRPSTVKITTCAELLNAWLKQHQGITDSTRERYQKEIDNYLIPRVGTLRVEDMDTMTLQSGINQIVVDFSRDAARHARGRLLQASRWGVGVRVLESNPVRETKIPGKAPRKYVFAPGDSDLDTLEAVLISHRTSSRSGPKSLVPWLAFEIMRGTGCRIGEVCALDWEEDVDLDAGTITFRDTVIYERGSHRRRGYLKNQDPFRTVYIPTWLVEALRPHVKESGPVLLSFTGGRVQPGNIRRSWRRAYEVAGVPEEARLTPHALRRAVATKLARELGTEQAARQLGDTLQVAMKHYIAPSFTGPVEAREVL